MRRPIHLDRARAALVRNWPGLVSLAIGGAMVLCILAEELRLRAATYAPFSDYWEHAAVLRALMDNPWHPSNPHLANTVPSPRFGPMNVLLALCTRALGLDAIGGLKIAAVSFTALFVLGIWTFFRTYFRDSRAGLYGLFVMLGGWWEAWTFASVYQPKVLLSVACYPWLGAFAVTLLGLAWAVRVLRRERVRSWEFSLLMLWAAVVFLTHQLTAMMALSAVFLLAATEPTVRLRRRAKVVLAVLAGCALSALWPYFSVWDLLAGGQRDAGWVGQGLQAAKEHVVLAPRHRFYRPRELFSALGLGLVTVLFLPYFFLRSRRLFVGLGALSMLGPFVVNAFIPLPLGHRFVLLAVFFLHAGVVWLCLVLTPGSPEFPPVLDRPVVRPLSRVLVWGVLLTFAYHNVQRTRAEWAYFANYACSGESTLIRYSRGAAELAGKGAVILGDSLTSWPIPAFGAKVVTLHHENPFVGDADERIAAVDSFFARRTTDEQRLDLIRRYHVTHVIVRHELRGTARSFLSAHASPSRLPAGYSLFTLSRAAN